MASRAQILNHLMLRYQKIAEHKLAVMRDHNPGTPYHTRASREYDGYIRKIENIKAQLERQATK